MQVDAVRWVANCCRVSRIWDYAAILSVIAVALVQCVVVESHIWLFNVR